MEFIYRFSILCILYLTNIYWSDSAQDELDLIMNYHRDSINFQSILTICRGFPGGSDSKESACCVGDPGSILGSGRSPGEGNGNPLQYSCLENPMDRGAWWVTTVHGVTKSQTQQSNFHFHKIQTAAYSKHFTYLDWFSPYSSIMLYYYYVLIFCPF